MGLWHLTKLVVGKFYKDDCFYLAAGIAYYSLFSTFPLLLGLVTVLSLLLGPDEAQARVTEVIATHFPIPTDFITENIRGLVAAGDFIGVLGLLGLLWSALGLFSALRRALNRVWGVQWDWRFLERHLLELAAMTGAGLMFMVSIGLSTGLRMAKLVLAVDYAVASSPAWTVLPALLSLCLVFATFSVTYVLLPHAHVRWREAWLGALLAALVYEGAKYLFLWYATNMANYATVYGSVTAAVIFLLWTYIAALIFLFGAELDWALRHPTPQPEL